VDIEGVRVTIRTCAFVRLESFDGMVDLLVSNILKGSTWGWVQEVRVYAIV
jgi:hypothetical protein